MAVIFSRARGYISSFTDPSVPARLSLAVENWGGYLGFKSIITRLGISSKGNFNALHSLGGQVFIYTFGERVGSVRMSGLSMDVTCDDQTGYLGIERVMAWYNANRVSARATPMKILLGALTALQVYLVGLNCDVTDPVNRLWQYDAEFLLVPTEDQDSGNNETGSSFSAEDTGPAAEAAGDGGDTGYTAVGVEDSVFPASPGVPAGDGFGYGGSAATPAAYPIPAGLVPGYAAYGTGPSTSLVTGW